MTRKKATRKKPGPQPGFQPAVNQRRALAKLEAITTGAFNAITEPTAQASTDPLQRSRDIRSMVGEELRSYARQIGVNGRDVTTLTDDRLRQNCMLVVNSRLEELME